MKELKRLCLESKDRSFQLFFFTIIHQVSIPYLCCLIVVLTQNIPFIIHAHIHILIYLKTIQNKFIYGPGYGWNINKKIGRLS
jgi:hypothetical protein